MHDRESAAPFPSENVVQWFSSPGLRRDDMAQLLNGVKLKSPPARIIAKMQKLARALPKPAVDLALPKDGKVWSEIEEFVFCLVLNNNNIFIEFLRFVPRARLDLVVKKLLSLEKVSFDVIKLLPNSDSVALKLCELSEDDVGSFMLLVSRYHLFSKEVQAHVAKCVKKFVNSKIDVLSIGVLMGIVFQKSQSEEILDVFLRTFVDCPSIIARAFCDQDLDSVFGRLPERFDLPVSFVKMLVLLNYSYRIPDALLQRYLVREPGMLFMYLFQLTDEHIAQESWDSLIQFALSSKTIGQSLQIDCLLGLLHTSSQHPQLMEILGAQASAVVQWVKEAVEDVEVIAVVLLLARQCEQIALEIIESDGLSFLLDLVAAVMNDVVGMSNVCLVMKALVEDNGSYPFVKRRNIHSLFLPAATKFAYSYAISIFPRLFALVMGVFYDKARRCFDEICNSILAGERNANFQVCYYALSDRDFLMKLVEDPPAERIVLAGLALSCQYEVFRKVFEHRMENLDDALSFLLNLSKNTPIVNDFMELEERCTFSSNICNSSLLIWVKTPIDRSKVFSLIGNSIKLQLLLDNSTITIMKDGTTKNIPLSGSIDSWNFVTVNISSKAIELRVNMQEIGLQSLQLGSVVRVRLFPDVYYQSVIVLRPTLSRRQTMQLFARGPNVKRVVDNFIHLDKGYASFVQQGFVSELYSGLDDIFIEDIGEYDASFEAIYELSLTPPYETIDAERTTRKSVKIKTKRYSYVQFFNSLEVHGGLSLIIHLVVEALLKEESHSRSLAFQLLDSLLNRFPFVHQYFIENHVYDMFAALNQNTCEFLKGNYVTNAFLLKSFLKTLESFTLPFSPHNVRFLNYIKAFQSAVLSISDAQNEVPESLIQCCLDLTNTDNKDEHALFVFNVIIGKHLQFSVGKRNKRQTVPLLLLLTKLLPCANIQIELMLPAILHCRPMEQVHLANIFLRYLPNEYNYPFAVYLAKISATAQIDEMLYQIAFEIPKERATFVFFYYATHDSSQSSLYALSSAMLSFVADAQYIPRHLYEQLVLIFSDEKIVNRDFLPKEITQDSVSTTPFGQITVAILRRALELGDVQNIQEFFKAIMAIDVMSELQLVKLCLFLIDRILYVGHVPQSFLLFVVQFATYLFNRVSLIPHEKSVDFSLMIGFFFEHLFHEIPDSTSTEIVTGTIDLILAFSMLNLSSIRIANDMKACTPLTKHRRFAELLDRIENPNCYSPTKAPKNQFQADIRSMRSRFHEDRTSNFLTLCCNSVLYQSVTVVNDIETANDSYDVVVEKWRTIFNSLMCPGSMIYRDCPVKYTVNEASTKVEVRRILMPLNPSTDGIYSEFWNEKYHEAQPSPRLTLDQVLNFSLVPSLRPTNSKFNESVERLTGISNVKGLLVLTDTKMKFYGRKFEDFLSVKYKCIRKVRMTKIRHQDTGIFVDDNSMRSLLFVFETPEKRLAFVTMLESFDVTIENTIDKSALEGDQAKWITGEMSTFDYLLRLNLVSGRSWSDFSRFPFFPWIMLDFSCDQFDVSNATIFRDFAYPLFAQSEGNRASCMEYYQSSSEMGEGIHFANYISNINSAIYYLVRLEPFATEEIAFQGGHFDHPDRIFHSVEVSKELMAGRNCSSALELVPEAYYMPEMFENINSINLSLNSRGKSISDVMLPRWAASPEDFTYKMRQALECGYVSDHIHEWIDLVWGVRREGILAAERCNCLNKLVFDFNQDEYKNDNLLLHAMNSQLHTCGIAPTQLFTSPHPPRKPKDVPLIPELVFDCDRNPTEQELKSLTFSNSKERWLQTECHTRLRIKNNTLDYQTNTRTSKTFSPHIKPTMVHHSRNDVVTAHTLPVLVHWSASKKGLSFVETLVGHTSTITSVFINVWSSVIMSGHCDGKISLFALSPGRFVRILTCKAPLPITMLRISRSNSDVIAFQETDTGTIMTMFSINGKFLGTFAFNHKVRACDSTSFPYGARENLILILTTDAKLIALSARTLEVLRVITDLNATRSYTSLVIVRNDWVLLPDTDRHVTLYRIR